MVDFRVSVVLPAAGTGSRMGSDTPKQYLKILDKPLISYTIEAFERIPWIETVVVVAPTNVNQKENLENIVSDFDHKKVVTTCGESTRHRSIYNGIRCLNTNERKPDIVIIHDAVRPFIEEVLLKQIVIAAKKHSACGVVRPLVSTVLAKNANGFLDHSLDRLKFVASEMPQAFKYDVILNAYQKCTPEDFEFGTECLNLALKYSNVQAFLIDGPDYLWKITYKKDIFAAQGIIAEQLRRRAVFLNEIGKELPDILKKQFEKNGVEIQTDERDNLFKVNILINFSLLQEHSCVGKDLRRNIISESLVRIERNGVLVIIDGGNEEQLAELRKTTEHLSRKSGVEKVICCGVWCKDFSPAQPQKTKHERIVRFAKMIVNVAMEISQRFSGQVFTVLDIE